MSELDSLTLLELKKLAKSVGITQYKIGPLVRSSYHAASLAEK